MERESRRQVEAAETVASEDRDALLLLRKDEEIERLRSENSRMYADHTTSMNDMVISLATSDKEIKRLQAENERLQAENERLQAIVDEVESLYCRTDLFTPSCTGGKTDRLIELIEGEVSDE